VSVARAAAIAACAALGACSGADGDSADAAPAAVTVGTGYDAFESLTDGDDIYVVQGPQGGFHVFGSFWATGIDPGDPDNLQDPGNPSSEFRVFDSGTRIDIVEANGFTQGLEPIDGTPGVGTIGRFVILDITDDAQLDGHTIRLEVTVTDVHGATASDARTLTAIPHPNNP